MISNQVMSLNELIEALQQIAAHESPHTPTTVVNVQIQKHDRRQVKIVTEHGFSLGYASSGRSDVPVGLLRAQ